MNTTNDIWLGLLSRTYTGQDIKVRDAISRETIGIQAQFDMSYPIVSVVGRKLNYKFMLAEALWILTGDMRVETIKAYCERITNFSDGGIIFQGAYGPRILEQMQYVIEVLEADKYSRQAAIEIWRPMPRPSRDIPCTLSIQFLRRQLSLHTIVTMRSSDVWLGLPYDIFNFTMISQFLLSEMINRNIWDRGNVQLGTLYMNFGSQHLYTSNIPQAESILSVTSSLIKDYAPWKSDYYISGQHLINDLQLMLKKELPFPDWV